MPNSSTRSIQGRIRHGNSHITIVQFAAIDCICVISASRIFILYGRKKGSDKEVYTRKNRNGKKPPSPKFYY